MTEKWAFTIKYNPEDCTEDQLYEKYKTIMKHWSKQKGMTVLEYRHEDRDKKGQPTKLHLHGTIEIPKALYRKRLMLPNYHIKLVHWTSGDWTNYINKNVKIKMVNKSLPHEDTCTDGGLSPMECDQIIRPTRPLFKRDG